MRPLRRVPTLQLGWIFLRIGATAFGGLGVALALIERELVSRRGLIPREEITRPACCSVSTASNG